MFVLCQLLFIGVFIVLDIGMVLLFLVKLNSVRANLLSSASLDSEAPHYFGYTTCTAEHLCGTLL